MTPPVTDKLPRVPRLVSDEAVTPAARAAPVSVPAAAVTVMSAEPLNATPLMFLAVWSVVAVVALPVTFPVTVPVRFPVIPPLADRVVKAPVLGVVAPMGMASMVPMASRPFAPALTRMSFSALPESVGSLSNPASMAAISARIGDEAPGACELGVPDLVKYGFVIASAPGLVLASREVLT